MRLIFVHFVLTVSLFAQNFELQEVYNVHSNDVYAKHIFKDLKSNFFLFSIPAHSNRFKISSKKLEAEFMLRSISVKPSKTGVVTFIKIATFDTTILKNELSEKFKKVLPTLKIDDISLVCRCKLKKLPKEYKIVIKNSLLHKNSGTFYIKSGKNRHFFTYSIKARLGVIKAKTSIKNNETLTVYNTYDDEIDFEHFNSTPLQNRFLSHVVAKRGLKKDLIITKAHIKKIPLIRRGENVRVQLFDGNVQIEFKAKALKNGSLRDIIPVRKPDGNRYDVMVIGKGTVSL